MQGYLAEKIAPVKCQKVDNVPVATSLAPSMDVNWLPDVACETISEA